MTVLLLLTAMNLNSFEEVVCLDESFWKQDLFSTD
jgi:hypothetical protein